MSILSPNGLPHQDRHGTEILTDFRNMMRLEDIFYEDLPEGFKLKLMLELLYGNDNIPANVEAAFKELTWFHQCGEDAQATSAKGKEQPRSYDFEEDASYIYSAFLSSYSIDLACEDTSIHWWKFMALFRGLPEDTKMSRRMYYRTVDTTKMSKDQKKSYEAVKKELALKSKRGKKPEISTVKDKISTRQKAIDKLYTQAQQKIKEIKESEVE